MTQVFRAREIAAHDQIPEHVAFMEATPKEVSVVFGGETVAKSRRVLIMHETRHLPVYYFPMEDVRMDLFEATDKSTH